MASSNAKVSPFTQAVIGAVRKLYVGELISNQMDAINHLHRYPESLADKSFDNTGRKFEISTSRFQFLTGYSPLRSTISSWPATELSPPDN